MIVLNEFVVDDFSEWIIQIMHPLAWHVCLMSSYLCFHMLIILFMFRTLSLNHKITNPSFELRLGTCSIKTLIYNHHDYC
jgi:hypothetical protein